MTFATYERNVRAAFGKGTSVHPKRGGGVRVELPCTGGHTASVEIDVRIPGDALAANLKRKGWKIESRRMTCPDHNQKEEKVPPPPEPASVLVSNTHTNQTPPATDQAKRAKRMIYMLLEEQYDEVKKCYRPGYDDAAVARETGASVEFVKSIRESDFGPITAPSEFLELCQKAANIDAQAVKFQSELAALRADLDAIAIKNGWRR